jgi:hypothetical protein
MQARGLNVNGMVAVEFLRECDIELAARSALG